MPAPPLMPFALTVLLFMEMLPTLPSVQLPMPAAAEPFMLLEPVALSQVASMWEFSMVMESMSP